MREDCVRCAPQHLRARKGCLTAVRTSVCAGRRGPSGAKLGVLTQAVGVTWRPCVPRGPLVLAGGGWDAGVELGVTTAKRLPNRATVVGAWNGSLVMTA